MFLIPASGSGYPRTLTRILVAATLMITAWTAACTPRTVPGGTAAAILPSPTPADPLLLQRPIVGRAVPCMQGRAQGFSCRDVDLLAFLPLRAIGGWDTVVKPTLTGIWGWTDSATGQAFVLVGRSDGTAFVDVTDPVNPRYLGRLPGHPGTKPSRWRDLRVYQHYAFIVSEAQAHGMQVFDLAQLRTVPPTSGLFQETAHYDGVASVHTIAIDQETGYAYLAGGNGGGETCGGGLHVVDLHRPLQPTFAGCYIDTSTGGNWSGKGYVHEATCVIYHGPDRAYQGRELCLNASETALGIIDVTDKAHPRAISLARYPHAGYVHQGWFSMDQRYFFVDDELDELVDTVNVPTTRTIVLDLQALDDPVVATEFWGPTQASDHNQYVRGRYLYQANYQAGLRILDIRDPRRPREVGYFDTYPASDRRGFQGALSNYPYFGHGVVAVASEEEGLFVIRHRSAH